MELVYWGYRDVCDTGWDESAEEWTHGEGGGAGGEKLKDKRQKETKHKQQEGEVKENASFFCPREPARQGRLSVGREREWGGRKRL
jgi:hypothetical protein